MAVVTNVIGGLGNQLFQYAMGYAVAKSNNDELYIDISHFAYEKREFQLDKFEMSTKILDVQPAKKDTTFFRMLARIRRLSKTGLLTTKFFQEDSAFFWQYAYPHIQYKRNLYLNGYWQHWRYFDRYQRELVETLQVKSTELSENAKKLIAEVSNKDTVAIHIRRGDYVQCDGWLIEPKFYLQAIDVIEKEKQSNLRYYVFCEDEEFAASLLEDKEYSMITGKYAINDVEEFAVMSACSNHIISNSSYSWWAAYLHKNRKEEQTVVAPLFKRWNKEFYLPNWKCISTE